MRALCEKGRQEGCGQGNKPMWERKEGTRDGKTEKTRQRDEGRRAGKEEGRSPDKAEQKKENGSRGRGLCC